MRFNLNNHACEIDETEPIDISIPLQFNGAQPNAYGVAMATSTPCETGELVGDTRRGGSCNFEQYSFIPHCNGTHTECVGHISNERISIRQCLRDVFVPAQLISLEPENANETGEDYAVEFGENDKLITRKALENFKFAKERNCESDFRALIIRTLPNDTRKLSRTYIEEIPAYFSTEAMKFIAEIGVDHLLVDLPSIDRIFDQGKLSNHRLFWNVKPGSFELDEDSSKSKTITELIYVPEAVKDGPYLLNLQIAPFETDAAPSRPILFGIK